MKKWMIFLTGLILLGCGSGHREIPIQGHLTFEGPPPDSVYIGLYSASTRNFLGEPVILLRESGDAFEMRARPGSEDFIA
ncbi:MAG TPA: hypothetical protein ENN03_00595 [bacterium]|nr:hypothetical protein [bacterium]